MKLGRPPARLRAPCDLVCLVEREPGLVDEAGGALRIGDQHEEVARPELGTHRAPALETSRHSVEPRSMLSGCRVAPAEHDLVPAHPELEPLLGGDRERVGGSFTDTLDIAHPLAQPGVEAERKRTRERMLQLLRENERPLAGLPAEARRLSDRALVLSKELQHPFTRANR